MCIRDSLFIVGKVAEISGLHLTKLSVDETSSLFRLIFHYFHILRREHYDEYPVQQLRRPVYPDSIPVSYTHLQDT